jgi:hypothetical protein
VVATVVAIWLGRHRQAERIAGDCSRATFSTTSSVAMCTGHTASLSARGSSCGQSRRSKAHPSAAGTQAPTSGALSAPGRSSARSSRRRGACCHTSTIMQGAEKRKRVCTHMRTYLCILLS